MSDTAHPLDQAIRTYQAILSDLQVALSAIRAQRLEALDAVLPQLDAWNQQLAAAGSPKDLGAGERAAEARRLLSEILAQSRVLEDLIRAPMRAVADELIQVNKTRLYLKSLRDLCQPTSPRIHWQS